MKELTTPKSWEDARIQSKKSYPNFQWDVRDREMRRVLHPHLDRRRGSRVLEIGCGASYWLPWFHMEYGMEAYGVDFSQSRIEQAKRNLGTLEAEWRLTWGNFITGTGMSLGWRGSFDVVFSAGVIEHFDPPAAALRLFASYAKSGGVLLTVLPLLHGIWGAVDGALAGRPDYLRLNAADVIKQHEDAGLRVTEKSYFAWADPGVVNASRLPPVVRETWTAAAMIIAAFGYMAGCLIHTKMPSALYSGMLVVSQPQ